MRRLTLDQILIPGSKMRTDKIDFDKEPELKRLFEETKKQQEKMERQKNQQFENLLITI